jgi:4-hydroxybenzoate polyprenyltransferase
VNTVGAPLVTSPLPDAAAANWVDRHAPAALRPWLKLARLDRPVGIWLLMLPTWQGAALAAAMNHALPSPKLLCLFAIGAVLMRAAGCAVNDMADRRMDARVARTAGRPLASGQISLMGAALFALACVLGSLGVLLALNLASLWIAAAALPLVIIYPFMKRITWWPQAWLGLTFNWGALLGFGAALEGASLGRVLMTGGLAAALMPPGAIFNGLLWRTPLALYAGGVFWTLGYDTIYAIQDMADDLAAGVKSSALRLGAHAPRAIRTFYAISLLFALSAGILGHLGPLFFLGLIVLAAQLEWQVRRLDPRDPAGALILFKSNTLAGAILFFALVAGFWRV